jgi:hypothetical protein
VFAGRRYQRGHMNLAVSLVVSLKQPCLCWKREQRP